MKFAKLSATVAIMPVLWAAFIVSGNYTPLYRLYGDLLTA
jgi:hypothetical protein